MAYEQYKVMIMPTKKDETPLRRLLAGSMAGVTSVLFSYPLELIRVRLAYEVTTLKNTLSLASTIRTIYNEPNPFIHPPPPPPPPSTTSPSTTSLSSTPAQPTSRFMRPIAGIANFYRGFFPTVYGMIPYAGVSFLTYETLKSFFVHNSFLKKYARVNYDPSSSSPSSNTHARSGKRNTETELKAWAYLTCGALSGGLAQTCSYPFEVIRRNMQVAGGRYKAPPPPPPVAAASARTAAAVAAVAAAGPPLNTTWETARFIWQRNGFRGFFVGLTIGYVKVAPMFAVSFYVYEWMKQRLGID
ncbi:hypothetical protein HK102_010081 [Quaeritorhiza haematococci]|nr:hypothetical protein HK102_010081 [Quaeritorhiza haematococci]